MSSGAYEGIEDWVGPVLEAGPTADALIALIRESHPDAILRERGSYVQVLVRQHCTLTRQQIEAALGRPFDPVADLKRLMPAFKGYVAATTDAVSWTLSG